MDFDKLLENPIVRRAARDCDDERQALKFFMKDTPENARTIDKIENAVLGRGYPDFSYGSESSNSWPRNRASNSNSNIDPALLGVSREIKRILRTDEFYEILDLGELSTQEEIKETYQTLASQFHPEACQEKGAADAFKKLAQAYDCLGDVEKRRKYNKCCEEEPDHPERLYRRIFNYHNINAEDVFKRSYGEIPTQNASTSDDNQKYNKTNKTSPKINPLVFIVAFVLIAAGVFFFKFVSFENGLYSFTQSSKYNTERETANLKLKYYIPNDLLEGSNEEKLAEIGRLGETVEKDYAEKLEAECSAAQNQKAQLREAIYQVSVSAVREALYKKMDDIDTSSCDKFDNIKWELQRAKSGSRAHRRDYY